MKRGKRGMKNPADPAISSRGKRDEKPTLPDDMFNDILSWLPAKDVVRYQCVCRNWRDLISTKDFVDLHTQRGMRRSSPMLLVEEWMDHLGYMREYFLDKWWVPKGKKSRIREIYIYPDGFTSFSLDGFVVVKSHHKKEIILFNPINHGKVSIVVPANMLDLTNVYGIFFNPALKEYCALFGYRSYNYKMLNLGSDPCWRDIRIPLKHKARGIVRPVVIHDYLYYLLGPEYEYEEVDHRYIYNGQADIMEFDINTEVFTSMKNPVPNTGDCYGFCFDLLNIDGFLSLVSVQISGLSSIDINIGTLRDRTKQLWTTSNYHFSLQMYPTFARPRALAVMDEELLIHSHKKLIVCNLKLGTARNFAKKDYAEGVSFIPHVVSLASLSNCKSKMYLEWEGVDPEAHGLW